jgi:AhpD family alkylhydroperoxidase
MSDQIDGLGGRLPLTDPEDLSPAQREIFDRMAALIVPWANDAQFQSTSGDGRLIGPFNPALLNPAIAAPFLDLQFAEQVHTSLTERVREVVILAVGAAWQADYELYAHVAVARKAGLSEQAARAIANGEVPGDLSFEENDRSAAHSAAVDQTSCRWVFIPGGRNRVRAKGVDRHRLPYWHLSLRVRDAHHVRDPRSRIGPHYDACFTA